MTEKRYKLLEYFACDSECPFFTSTFYDESDIDEGNIESICCTYDLKKIRVIMYKNERTKKLIKPFKTFPHDCPLLTAKQVTECLTEVVNCDVVCSLDLPLPLDSKG
jgi:hypothetical protein